MQEAMIVDAYSSRDNLNKKLEQGWRVVETCPMPSKTFKPTCLVIIEECV